MNSKQKRIFQVIKALFQIKNFPELFNDSAIRYGVLNYVAKYSLAKDKYLITNRAFKHLIRFNFLKNGALRKGLKSKKNGFTFEHPIPSNIISSELLKYRYDETMIIKILKWSDLIVILTTDENLNLKKYGFERNMPNDWKFFKSDQFDRYKKSDLLETYLKEIVVYGEVKR